MSERGLLLALQRLHDDPGFSDMVCSDPEHTLGIYDLDESDCALLTNACQNKDTGAVVQLARSYGIDWQADHVTGTGALDDQDVSIEQHAQTGINAESNLHIEPGAMSGDGYAGVRPSRPAGT